MSSEKKFSIGSLVKLISGGPVMTINDIEPQTSRVKCVWFSNERLVSEFSFSSEALRDAYESEIPYIPPADPATGAYSDQVEVV